MNNSDQITGAIEPTTGPRSIRDIIADLSKDINPKRLKQRQQAGQTLTYLPWYEAVRYLDHYAPGWSYEIRQIHTYVAPVVVNVKDKSTGKVERVEREQAQLVMVARISIPCSEGLVYREASALEVVGSEGYGDAATNAESAALRRAAAKFGLALYLYDK